MRTNRDFLITRVVTRDMVTDSFQWVKNMFGLRLRRYEDMIKKAHKEIIEEMRLVYPNILWYKMSINPMVDGAVMVTIYGEFEDEST